MPHWKGAEIREHLVPHWAVCYSHSWGFMEVDVSKPGLRPSSLVPKNYQFVPSVSFVPMGILIYRADWETIYQEANTTERKTDYLHFPRGRGMPCHARPHRTPGVIRKQKEWEESLGQSLYWGFCRKSKAGQSKQLKWVSLHNSGGLWVTGVVSSCLVPGLVWFRAEEILAGCVTVR